MNPISFPHPAAMPTDPARDPRLARAAYQFEALLLETLIGSLEKGFALPAKDNPLGASSYGELGVQALAGAVSRAGGIGLSAFVMRNLQKTRANVGAHPPSD